MLTILNKGYKFKIKPDKQQKEFLLKSFGCKRKIYNIYVDSLYKYLEANNYKEGIIKGFKTISPAQIKSEYEYMKEVDSLALCNAEIDFKNALNKYNKECDKKSYKKKAKKRQKTLGIIPTFKDLKGIPNFKSIKKNDFSYKTNNQSHNGKWCDIKLQDKFLSIPKLKTLIKVVQHRDLPENCIIKNITITMDYKGIFYVSLCIEYSKDIIQKKSEKVLGLDYSQNDFYVSNEGEKANYPKYYKNTAKKLKLEQRKLSRKTLKSNNWYKHKKKITKIQTKIANQRLDWLHKKSTELAKNYDAVIVEDIDLRAMSQCLHLGKNLHDNGFGMFRLFLKYKLTELGKQFIKVNKFFASSQICSCCGYKNEEIKDINIREWICPSCGVMHDRDINAGINIKEAGQSLLAW